MTGAFLARHNTVALVAGTTENGYEGAFIRELRRSFPRLTVDLVDLNHMVYELPPLAYAKGRKGLPKARPLSW